MLSSRLLAGVVLVVARVKAQCPCVRDGFGRSALFGSRPTCPCPDPGTAPICSWDGDMLSDAPSYVEFCPDMVATYGCGTPWSTICPGVPFPNSAFPTGDETALGNGCRDECPDYALSMVNLSMQFFPPGFSCSTTGFDLSVEVPSDPVPRVCIPDASGNGQISYCNMTTRAYVATNFPGDPNCTSTTAMPQEFGYGECVNVGDRDFRTYCGDATVPLPPAGSGASPPPPTGAQYFSIEFFQDAGCASQMFTLENMQIGTEPWPVCSDHQNGFSGKNMYCDPTTRSYHEDTYVNSDCSEGPGSGPFSTVYAYGECVAGGVGSWFKYYCFSPTVPAA